ncbi:hypothetical protein BDA96_02G229200 [Sorghum bicolor]|uniref:Glycosyltransferase n=1 Tax=Sorghum bicolor TaxID=4558 RepID=A0A921RQK8_SORBI|nr:hypothetical protein BDA96_02G229200 [Sorghum bicolor]
MDATSGSSMHFVMMPWLAVGHILPFTELARRIALQGHRVTLLSTPRNTRRLIDIPPDLDGLVHVVDVPLPRVERLPEDAEATMDLRSDDLRPCLRRAYDAAFSAKLSKILQGPEPSSRPDWVLIDHAAYWAPAAAARHGVPCAFLSVMGAASLGFFGPPEALMGRAEHAKTKLEHLTAVPDYVPFPTTVAYRVHEVRAMFKKGIIPEDGEVSDGYRMAKSIEGSQLVGARSSRELEPEWLQLVGELYKKPVIPLGLLPPPPTQDAGGAGHGHEATLRWLDRQAPRSVVYVAFGSEAKLTSAQLHAVALGLEAFGVPFLWAYRAPADSDASDSAAGLPEGFEERVSGWGLVCRGWLPQARLLAHRSVGGFVTHAGWGSVAEGLARGVRLVMLPLLFDHGLNARHLVEKKLGVEVARDEDDGSFTAEDVAAALRRVMVGEEGQELGAKAQELAQVVGNDEVNDQCVRDFLRCLSEYGTGSGRQQQGIKDDSSVQTATHDATVIVSEATLRAESSTSL